MKRNRRFLLGLAALVTLVSCARTIAAPPNILLIVVDTLRADRLGCYGNADGLTPFLDSLSARGVVFRNAYAASCWTSPSVASLLTSRYKSQHGIVSFGSVLREEEVTLPELLRDAGYTTGAFSANSLLTKRNGFSQGYDEYDAVFGPATHGPLHPRSPTRGDKINRLALSWLDSLPQENAKPVFLYLHYMEPHPPYRPSPSIMDRVFAGRKRPDLDEVSNVAVAGSLRDVDAETLRAVEQVYDAEVMSLDIELRALFAELQRRGFLDNALVVITADHGEEFLDHGLIGHGHDLSDSVIRVPLVILVPGQSRQVDVTEVVSLVDLAPSLLDWLGIPSPETFEGTSFREMLARADDSWWSFSWPRGLGRTRPRHVVYSELIKSKDTRLSPHQRAVIRGPYKLIAGVDGEREFYDLVRDPGETGRTAVYAAEQAALEQILQDFVERNEPGSGPRPVPPIDEETRERMRALGYQD